MSIHKTAVLLAAVLVLTAGCGKKNSGSGAEEASVSISEASTSETVSTSVTTETYVSTQKTTTATTSAATASTTSVTTASADETTTEAVEQTAEAPANRERPACADLAEAFYQAYLDHDAEKVYAMFEPGEMKAYSELIKDELEGRDPAKVFRKESVISALNASMDNIGEIMEHYSDGEDDVWTFSIPDDELSEISGEELEAFNKDLGTSFTRACICQYMFYNDETNGETFTGNSAAFVELDGKWYLSYSTAMGMDLVYFIEFD